MGEKFTLAPEVHELLVEFLDDAKKARRSGYTLQDLQREVREFTRTITERFALDTKERLEERARIDARFTSHDVRLTTIEGILGEFKKDLDGVDDVVSTTGQHSISIDRMQKAFEKMEAVLRDETAKEIADKEKEAAALLAAEKSKLAALEAKLEERGRFWTRHGLTMLISGFVLIIVALVGYWYTHQPQQPPPQVPAQRTQ